MRLTPEGHGTGDVRVPRLVGLMAVDARESVRALGLVVDAPGQPDFPHAVVDYVVRQYPQPGTFVPRHSVVHVWLDFGEGEGGGGVREPRGPLPPPGGLRRELEEPGAGAVTPLVVLGSP
ncbi:PASTA domain-containing protein [Streptomyces cellulosae]|uniref:PASTA domain-containing protein n=1 Tax=Streptomyces thermocarboxydus TaxID=59299 RepID=A0ABU3J6S0_9ACTN|nr:PASTA domain-containing protein [Streptomyces sp. McG8]MDT6969713.1 PASTA domain-containing protein [Streptomyces thermocarboxydus]